MIIFLRSSRVFLFSEIFLDGPGWGDRAITYADGAVIDEETVKTLTDLARQNKEMEFREMAACVGVPGDQIDALWTGTRRRVHRETKAAP